MNNELRTIQNKPNQTQRLLIYRMEPKFFNLPPGMIEFFKSLPVIKYFLH